jgi:hypothetical protein
VNALGRMAPLRPLGPLFHGPLAPENSRQLLRKGLLQEKAKALSGALRLPPLRIPDSSVLSHRNRPAPISLTLLASCRCLPLIEHRAYGFTLVNWGFAGPLRAASSVSLCRARLQGAVSSLRCGPHQPLSVCARQSAAFRLALRGRQRANARKLAFIEGQLRSPCAWPRLFAFRARNVCNG